MTHALKIHDNWQEIAVKNIALILCGILFLSMFMIGSTTIAFCNDATTATTEAESGSSEAAISSITTAFNDLVSKIYTSIRKIITPLAAVAFAFAGVQFIIGGQRGTEKARTLIIAGVAGIALVVFAPLLAKEVANWGVGIGNGGLNDYNPL